MPDATILPTDTNQPHSEPRFPSRAAETYTERLSTLAQGERQLHRRHLALGYLRLLLGIAFVVLLFPPRWYALLPLVLFAIAARIHGATLARLAATRRSLEHYQLGLARLEDRWAGLRPRQVRQDLSSHLYATDLDLFGPASLFELLCGARTTVGEDVLASWLLHPAAAPTVLARQTAVQELQEQNELREALAAAPGPAIAPLHRDDLAAWGAATSAGVPVILGLVAPVLVALTFLAAWRYATAQTPLALIVLLILDASLTFGFARAFRSAYPAAEQASRSLAAVAALSRELEQPRFTATHLNDLQAKLRSGKRGASDALVSLARLVRWAEARNNYVVRILDTPLLYSLQLSVALGRWHRRHGAQIGTWLDTLGEFEALLSLAGYSFEHPEDPFPNVAAEGTVFSAKGLGHPLLPASQCVRNDLALGEGARLLLVSGSNMSGKSTLLRSVGVNAVLAFAGGPVRARSLSISPLHLGASIHVNDSLLAGRSRFYAEILRLRAITEAAQSEAPLLFLIDEVLAGTNSSDRLAGARGLAKALLDAGAIGLLSTHDLALTGLSVKDAGRIRNAHFEDQVGDDQLRFDYRLRSGVLQRSNGLALMRLIGLDV